MLGKHLQDIFGEVLSFEAPLDLDEGQFFQFFRNLDNLGQSSNIGFAHGGIPQFDKVSNIVLNIFVLDCIECSECGKCYLMEFCLVQ